MVTRHFPFAYQLINRDRVELVVDWISHIIICISWEQVPISQATQSRFKVKVEEGGEDLTIQATQSIN